MTRVVETRTPKAEGRKKSETRSPNPQPRNSSPCGFRAIRPFRSLWITPRPFGSRISAFFRPSDFGLRPILTLLLYLSTSAVLSSADTNPPPDLPPASLKPPRGEILPSFWEQNGTWIIFASVAALFGIGVLIRYLTRPKPAAPVPWAVQARQELESLRHQPENGYLLSRTSQIVRHYIARAFLLPAGELNTSEFCGNLQACEKIGPELALEIIVYLRESDLRKFAPGSEETPLGALARAESIIERTERRLAELNRAAFTPGADLNSPHPPKPDREQGLASGA
jgi:hypothetical protein